MKTITFIYPHHSGAYGCSEPGDNAGEYVRADVARELLSQLKDARLWIGETNRKDCKAETYTELLENIDAAIANAEGGR